MPVQLDSIRRRRDYITGFIAPAIGPNKSRKLTRLIAPTHNIRGKVWMKNNIPGFTDNNCLSVCEAMYVVFHSNFAAYIVSRCYKPCGFPGFVWTDCWGNKSYYVITFLANTPSNSIHEDIAYWNYYIMLSVYLATKWLLWPKQMHDLAVTCGNHHPQ